jgi:hypothetical protein
MKISKTFIIIIIIIIVVVMLVGLVIQVLYDPISSVRHSVMVSNVRAELPQARAKWDAAGITDYTFEIQGIAPLICQPAAMIEVSNNSVVKVEAKNPLLNDSPAQILPPEKWADPDWGEEVFLCSYYHFTMQKIFDLVEVTLQNYPASIMQAEFDPEYGFVTKFEYGLYVGNGLLRPKVSECCRRLEIKNFQVLNKK